MKSNVHGRANGAKFVRLPGGCLLNLDYLVWVDGATEDDGQFECSIYLAVDTFAIASKGIHFRGEEAELLYNTLEELVDIVAPEGKGPAHGAMVYASIEEPEEEEEELPAGKPQ